MMARPATSRSAFAPGRSLDVMIENEGHRGFRRDGWEVVTFEDEKLAPEGFAQIARAW